MTDRQAVKKGDVVLGWEEDDDDKSREAKFPQGAVNTRGSETTEGEREILSAVFASGVP